MNPKLESISIKNFKSLREATFRPGALSVLIGPNASGKSNLLLVFELMSAIADGRLADFVQSRVGISSLAWDGLADRVELMVRFSAQSGVLDEGSEHADETTQAHWGYEIHLSRLGSSGYYEADFERLGKVANSTTQSDAGLMRTVFSRDRGEILIDSEMISSGRQRLGLRLQKAEPDAIVKRDEAFLGIKQLGVRGSDNLRANVQDYFIFWKTYHDFRTDASAPVRGPSVTRYDETLSPSGDNLISVLHTLYSNDREFRDDINAGMKAAFGPHFEELVFPPAGQNSIQLSIRWKGMTSAHPSYMISDGTLRFLYLLTILANPNPGGLIAIDEPETGLHPRMFPIIAEFAVQASTRTQVVLATHSPEFLSAFDDHAPTVVVAELDQGATTLRSIEQEELARWLKDYSLGEAFRCGDLEAMG